MKFFTTSILFLIGNLLFAQVQIVAEQDQDRNLSLMAFNKSVIPYTIQIEFLKLENLESLEGRFVFAVAMTGKTNLIKLQSIYTNEKVGFQYNTKLYKGNYQAGDLPSPPYLVPVKEGKVISMRPLTVQLPENPKNSESHAYTGAGFFFEKPTIICAPRKGIISEIKMDGENASSGPSDFNSENFIEIYHQDGTFSRLTGLKANSAKVTVGETVFPGQEIAESSSAPNQETHHVKMVQSRWEMGDFGMTWVNFPVSVFTDQREVLSSETISGIESLHPRDIISMEMDKKELKKYAGK
ncbi:hypothetical protein [Algoriphagus sp. CAU 1675]|uniref:hypothetical protein n=1 Tax=Algoriphagus sp. CAU 1675 TaxID=3032597 RepID=UPI0023DB612D|nr:hypothetical protein [Algoriphagus sp. CAU 1675]MDF2157229.1 hypothetical protein [Algoriphagus sp. CAU 1675]